MKAVKFFAPIFLALFFAGAHSAPAEFSDPDDAARYWRLISELRCLVCQNQNLADSNAALARDMREVVARMVREGKPDRAVVDFMTARYGDFVLYRPPFRPSTWALWLGPPGLVLLGLLAVAAVVRRPRRAALDADEKRRAAKILEDE